MPDDSLQSYEVLSETDLQACSYKSEIMIKGVDLSAVAWVTLLQAPSSEPTDQLRNDIKLIMRLIQDRLRRFGVICPAVALLFLSDEDTDRLVLKQFKSELEADQEWHKGEFIVFVESSREAADARKMDLMRPNPPSGPGALKRTLSEVIEECDKESAPASLLASIVNSWRATLSDSAADELESMVKEAIRAHLNPPKYKAQDLLRSLA